MTDDDRRREIDRGTTTKTFTAQYINRVFNLIIAITLALVVGGIIMYLFIGVNPITSIKLFLASYDRAGWGEVLYRATPLIFTGLAVALAFQCGLFNIGGEGQMVMGGFAGYLDRFHHQPARFLADSPVHPFRSGRGAIWAPYQAILRLNLNS